MENKIIVIYVGVKDVRTVDIDDYVSEVTKKIIPTTLEGEFIVIPTQTNETKMECINPVYITNEKLINEHEILMKNLNIELKYALNNMKENE